VRFRQIIEFRTSRIDDFNAHLDAWISETEGQRIPHRAVVCHDRDAENTYLLTVEFSSHAVAMENSGRPETGEFAAFLTSLCDGPLEFRNLDVLRADDL
jgi:hypothetical protein